MKELEALELLNNRADWYCSEAPVNYDECKVKSKEAYELVKKLLTPPTSEEVCKAIEESYLSNVAEMGVIYDSANKAFRMKKTYNCICEYDEYEKKINYHWIVTPELSILIGRFYQGVEK